jgi:hypothetical protein
MSATLERRRSGASTTDPREFASGISPVLSAPTRDITRTICATGETFEHLSADDTRTVRTT